ncbi:uncharacterized protein LOC144605170 [Rhinoraja longicauda]
MQQNKAAPNGRVPPLPIAPPLPPPHPPSVPNLPSILPTDYPVPDHPDGQRFPSTEAAPTPLQDRPKLRTPSPPAQTPPTWGDDPGALGPDRLTPPPARSGTPSPLALLLAAKDRDRSRSRPATVPDTGTPAPTPALSKGGTRYIRTTNPNSFQVAPRAVTAAVVHGAPPGTDGAPPSAGPPCGPPAQAADETDMASLLLPPPPLFSDEDFEEPEPALPFLPPPAEFSNNEDPGPEAALTGGTGLGPLPAAMDPPTPSAQDSTPNTVHISRPSINPLASFSNWAGQKPLIAPKPNSTNLNGTPAKAPNAGQPLPDATWPAHAQAGPETGLATNSLQAKTNVMGELRSKVQTLSTQSQSGSKSVQSSKSQSHGKTFTIRPGAKQPMTVVEPSSMK